MSTMKPRLIYVASPYAHRDPAIMDGRARIVSKFTLRMMHAPPSAEHGASYYSPIACHAPWANSAPPEHWHRLERAMMGAASELWVLPLIGWESSEGLERELKLAHYHRIGVKCIPINWVDHVVACDVDDYDDYSDLVSSWLECTPGPVHWDGVGKHPFMATGLLGCNT